LKLFNYILLLALLVCFGCSEKQSSTAANAPILFSDFENFPDAPFICLNLDTSVTHNIVLLKKEDFISTEPLDCSRRSDSTFILFNDHDDLSDLKIYLKSTDYLDRNKTLFDYLKQNSDKTIGNHEFSEMLFLETDIPFNLTYFSTHDFIRLSFKIISTKH
jgi:hypothetical protein